MWMTRKMTDLAQALKVHDMNVYGNIRLIRTDTDYTSEPTHL